MKKSTGVALGLLFLVPGAVCAAGAPFGTADDVGFAGRLWASMEKQGLVRRVKDLKRKNQVRIVLTPKGKKAYDLQNKTGVINKIAGCPAQSERASLIRLLEKLRNSALVELRARLPLPYTY